MKAQKPREIAVRILQAYARGFEFLETLLEQELTGASLQPADRGLVHELTYGVVRWQAPLDFLISRKTAGRTQKVGLQILLRLGLYQMFWLSRIPEHAAVHETVELAKEFGFGPQAGFINAILRGYGRERAETRLLLDQLRTTNPAVGFSHPDWLFNRWQPRWGAERTAQLMDWNNQAPPTCARLNTLKAKPVDILAAWDGEGVRYSSVNVEWAPEDLVYRLEEHPPLATLDSFCRGMYYIQDPSTLLAPSFVKPERGQRILDLCAAPGGKTTYLAQMVEDEATIVASDTSPARLQLVEENCQRLGVTSVRTSILQKNAPPAEPYDAILIDAPCSNTGVIRRRVDLRWRIRPEEIERLASTQLGLLNDSATQVKVDGALVYSTCSLEPEENQHVVGKFLEANRNFQLERERLLLPFEDGVDGAYCARLVRTS